jgi:GTP pyrophosphokinase
MQIQRNCEGKNCGREDEYFWSCAPPVRVLEDQRPVATFFAGEEADWRRALNHTLAEMPSLSWRFDPSIQLYGRIKSIASISDKMANNALDAHQILDIIGVRAITQRTRDCYQLVNRIHREFEVLEDEYDDYIAVPKPNGYRSIHTTVISPCGFPVEIQIRTHWMHELCKRGPAAHSLYKKNRIPWIPLSTGSLFSRDVA